MASATLKSFEFGPYRLDPAKRLLTRHGKSVALPPKTFDLLLLLVDSRGRVLTKKELMSLLWSDTFVEEANLSFQISTLRKALDEGGTEWIETLPRYGYRFKGEVSEVDLNSEADVSLAPEKTETVAAHGSGGGSVEGRPIGAERASAFWRARANVPRRAFFVVPLGLAWLVAVLFAVMYFRERQPPPERVVRFQIPPPAGVILSDIDSIALSPDGERLIFIGIRSDGKRLLWVRPL